MINTLIIGGGGREHALAWKLKQSPKVGKIFVAPGNAGTAQLAENIDIKATNVLALADFAEKEKISLTVVGPDDALALGIVDEFQKRGLKIWGPSKAAAKIEASKAFAKDLMKKQNIPTAEFQVFNNYQKAIGYIENHFLLLSSRPSPSATEDEWRDPLTKNDVQNLRDSSSAALLGMTANPIVIKASGLALGKGVTICKTLDEAKTVLKEIMVDKIFGEAGNEVVIEEFLQGREFSIHAFCDGKIFKLLPSSQDHKAINDGGTGPNTGGMGTIAPVPWVNEGMMEKVSSTIVKPALAGLKKLDSAFVGLLYPGLISPEGAPLGTPRGAPSGVKVIEFNARFGDPETQSYMRLLKTDLYDILEACVDGKLSQINIEWSKKYACCIVLASGGYPGKYEKGKTITGIDEAEKLDDIIVFHAGTLLHSRNRVTNGGRVLGVTAVADDLQSALDKAYSAVKLIHFNGMNYRTDIGKQSLTISN